MNLSLDTSFIDDEMLVVLAVQSFIKSKASSATLEALRKHKTSSWSLSIISKFMTFLRTQFEELPNQNDVLSLLSHLIDCWSDTNIYTTMVLSGGEGDSDESMSFSMLTILTDDMLHGNVAAMVVVSKIWQALERVQSTVCCGSPANDTAAGGGDAWWIDVAATNPNEWKNLAQLALAYITQSGALVPHTITLPNQNDVYCGHVTILTSLLQFQVCDWITPLASDTVKQLKEALLLDASVWQLASQPPPSTGLLQRGLMAMRLLALIPIHLAAVEDMYTQEFDTMANSSSLVEHVVQVAFPAITDSGSSSSQAVLQFCNDIDTQNSSVRSLALSVIQAWSQQSNGETWAHFLSLERRWASFLSGSWSTLIKGDDIDRIVDDDVLQGMLLLHQLCPLQAKSTIETAAKSQSHQESSFADRLLALCCAYDERSSRVSSTTATCAAALLRLLLSDRRDEGSSSSEALSSQVWTAVEQHKDSVISLVVSLARSASSHTNNSNNKAATTHSLLVVMLDVLDLAFQYCPNAYGASVGTKEIELLIDLMRISSTDSMDEFGMDVDEETPLANNLSRVMDETYLDITTISIAGSNKDEEEESKASSAPQGMDPTIAAAAATAVARYGATCQSKSQAMKSRIHGVIHDYVGSFFTPKNDITFDLHRRFFRLQTLAASASNVDEAMLAATKWKQIEYHRHELQTRADEVTQYQQQINQLNERIQSLMAEKREVQLSVKSQAVLFQRQLNKSKSAARIETSRLVEHHVEERSKVDHRVADAMRRTKIAESKQEEAEQRIAASKDSERKANEELHTERAKVLNAERVMKEIEAANQKKNNEISQLCLKMEEVQAQISEKADQVATIEMRLGEKDSQLQHASQAHGELQEELESAYEKLVNLAQIYEEEESATEETSRKLDRDARNSRRKLEHEIRRNEELEEDNMKLQRDGERLAKKLERAKERLQNELQDRADEKERRKRTGPISYINQLHTNTNESQRSSAMSSKDRSRLFAGKENSFYSSSSSRSKGRSFSER